MKHLIAAIALSLSPVAAQAACSGTDYLQTLDAETTRALDEAVAATPFNSGLTWTAEKNGVLLTLIGTMHIYDDRLLPIYIDVVDALDEADLLLVEAGPEEEATMTDALTSQPDLIFITEGPTLPEQLDEPVWTALAEAARDRQIPAFLAAKMQPWYLMLTLSVPACAMAEITQGIGGLDKMLIEAAGDRDVPIAALEPWDTLFTIMQSGTPDEQLEMLQMGLLPTTLQTQMYVGMLNAYFAGDVARIWEASRIASAEVPGLDEKRAEALFAETEDLLLNDRNRNWIPVIEQAASQHDRIVVAAGAAHLPGEAGILSLLQEGGWTIAPLNLP